MDGNLDDSLFEIFISYNGFVGSFCKQPLNFFEVVTESGFVG